ncbi:hypothetical protein ACRAWF_07375 [Streptomyces sp. L7]
MHHLDGGELLYVGASPAGRTWRSARIDRSAREKWSAPPATAGRPCGAPHTGHGSRTNGTSRRFETDGPAEQRTQGSHGRRRMYPRCAGIVQ